MPRTLKIFIYAIALILWSGGMFYAGARTFNVHGHVLTDGGVKWAALPLDADGNLKIAIQ